MRLYLFNPSHDEALAAGVARYTPPRAARALAVAWGAMSWLVAEVGEDVVLCDDEAGLFPISPSGQALAPDTKGLPWHEITAITPWGWDWRIVARLRRAGAPPRLLPSDAQMHTWRRLSSRESAVALLPRLRARLERAGIPTFGRSAFCTSWEEVARWLEQWETGAYIKAPWSCSGRGVMRKNLDEIDENCISRVKNWISHQDGVSVEEAFAHALDFALEFEAEAGGEVRFVAPSSFRTDASGRYKGNLVGTTWQDLPVPAPYVAPLVEAVRDELQQFLQGRYAGPLGVDLLVENGAPWRIDPCVEINFRRTMGRVAAEMSQKGVKKADVPAFLQETFYFCSQ